MGIKRKPITWVENWEPARVVGLDSPCHDCTSHATDQGYPQIVRNGEHQHISRFLYEQEYGFLHRGTVVRHKCDNRKCINILHLLTGTQKENVADSLERAKLKEEDIIFIRTDTNLSSQELAEKFNIRRQYVNEIRRRETWTHI